MKKDFRLYFKLMKYAYGYKDEICTFFIMFILGILLFLADGISNSLGLGTSLFIILAPGSIIKAIYSLSYSYMMCSSAKRKKLELIIPNIWNIATICFSYWFWILLVKFFLLTGSVQWEAEVGRWIIWSSLLHTAVLIVMGITAKYYWQSVLFISVPAIGIMIGEIFWDEGFAGFTEFGLAAVVGFVITFAGALFSCILRTLAYKKPVVRGRIGKQMLGVQ